MIDARLNFIFILYPLTVKTHVWKKGRESTKNKKPRRKFHFKQIARFVIFVKWLILLKKKFSSFPLLLHFYSVNYEKKKILNKHNKKRDSDKKKSFNNTIMRNHLHKFSRFCLLALPRSKLIYWVWFEHYAYCCLKIPPVPLFHHLAFGKCYFSW